MLVMLEFGLPDFCCAAAMCFQLRCVSLRFSDVQAVSLSLVAAWTAEAKLREAEAADLRRPELMKGAARIGKDSPKICDKKYEKCKDIWKDIWKDPDVSNVLMWKGWGVLQTALTGLLRIQSGFRWICEMGASSSRRCISGNSSALFSDLQAI